VPPEWAPESQTNAISHAIDPPISQMSVYWRRRPITNERIRHSCAIQAGTGNVVCWGDNGWGEAAPPDTVNGVSGTATDITTGVGHSCAIQAGTGNAVCWGADFDGRSSATRKMVVTVDAVDAPGVTCDPGEFSNPTSVNLKMEDDSGNILIDSSKTIVCEGGLNDEGMPKTINLKRNVFFRGPLNCENGAVPPPKPDFSLGTITSTGTAPGTADYVEGMKIKCFE